MWEELLLQGNMNFAMQLTDLEGNFKNSAGSLCYCHMRLSGTDHITGQPVALVQRRGPADPGRSWLLCHRHPLG